MISSMHERMQHLKSHSTHNLSLLCALTSDVCANEYDTVVFPSFADAKTLGSLFPQERQAQWRQLCQTEFAQSELPECNGMLIHEAQFVQGVCSKILALHIPEEKLKKSALEESGKAREKIVQIIESILTSLSKSKVQKFLIPVSAILQGLFGKIDPNQLNLFFEHLLRHLHQSREVSDRFQSKLPYAPFAALQEICFLLDDAEHLAQAKKICEQARAIVTAIARMQELANLPANYCTPTFICETVQRFAQAHADSISVTVHDPAALEKMKMNGILSVAAGSRYPAYLLEIHYRPKKSTTQQEAPIALVGKGITFDSGGLSLKPANAMEQMKFDMCGAATVFGVLNGLVELKTDLHVVGLLPVCENMVSQNSYRPGDILTLYSGLTVEIANTDAEGRLILADALAYAETTLNPKAMIDVATLTGSCRIALGGERSGLFSNNDALAQKLFDAGESCNDKLWRMPMDKAYDPLLRSSTADCSNCGHTSAAGSISAARFLSKFVQKTPWAHIDIAGTAYNESGRIRATGRPVSALLHYLMGQQ